MKMVNHVGEGAARGHGWRCGLMLTYRDYRVLGFKFWNSTAIAVDKKLIKKLCRSIIDNVDWTTALVGFWALTAERYSERSTSSDIL